MRLYDTARRDVVPFEAGSVVTIYTCGITPYDATHVGHAAVYLTFDILQRRLRDLGHETRCVRNITDIDDDILRKAKELGVSHLDLVASETAKFDADMVALDMLPSWSEPYASSAIKEIIEFASKAIELGHAYEVDGTVFFCVESWPKFGEVSGYTRDEMIKLAAERGGFPDDTRKKDPLDFVLWQKSEPHEPSWESPWSDGRPGWHIECSALIKRELGDVIDIHGGGADLIFPHHECEAAQSEAVGGKPFVRHWMHQAMVRMDGQKMSKSLGNMEFISDLRRVFDPRSIRLAILENHYRIEWEWNPKLLPAADIKLKKWISSQQNIQRTNPSQDQITLEKVREALDNDLDTSTAIKSIDKAVEQNLNVTDAALLLGIRL